MSFIKDIVDNSDDTALTAAIVAMAHKLGKRALAEGVEDKEQADTLLALGCDSAQGWLFGRPVPAAELSFAREEFTPLAIEPDPFCELPAANGGYRRPYRSIRSEIQAWSRDPAGIPSATRCRGTRRAGRMNRPSS